MQWDLLAAGVALAAATVLVGTRMRDRRIIPLVAHNGPWAVGLVIAGSGLIRYERMPASGLGLISVAIVTFNLGIVAARRLDTRLGSRSADVEGGPLSLRAYLALALGFLLGFASLLATIQRLFGLSVLLTDAHRIRAYSDVQYLVEFPLWGKLLFYLGPLVVTLTANPTMVRGLGRLRLPWRGAIIALVLLAQAASLQRTNIFVSVLLALAVYAYREGADRRHAKRLIVSGTAVALVCLVAFVGIGIGVGKTSTVQSGDQKYLADSIRGREGSQLLLYASSGIVAFGHLTQSHNDAWPEKGARGVDTLGDYNPQTWGAASFASVLKLVPISRPWPEVEPFTKVPVLTNVYTWLSPWYRDFRLPGLVVFPFAVALVAGTAALRSHRSPAWALIAGLMTVCVAWAPFTNRLLSTMTIELLALSAALVLVENRRRTRETPIDVPSGPSPHD